MELNLQQRRKALLVKIPDMEQTLSVVNFLAARRRKALGDHEEDEEEADDDDDIDALLDGDEDEGEKDKPLTTLFELNDTLYAEAQVQETGEVGLWLGVSCAHFASVEAGAIDGSLLLWVQPLTSGKHHAHVPPPRGC